MQYTSCTHTFVPRNTTKLTTIHGTSPCRRHGDDSHRGEEIYTPSGDETRNVTLEM